MMNYAKWLDYWDSIKKKKVHQLLCHLIIWTQHKSCCLFFFMYLLLSALYCTMKIQIMQTEADTKQKRCPKCNIRKHQADKAL